jgi:hypothetical protein
MKEVSRNIERESVENEKKEEEITKESSEKTKRESNNKAKKKLIVDYKEDLETHSGTFRAHRLQIIPGT